MYFLYKTFLVTIVGGSQVDMLFIQKDPADEPEMSDVMAALKIDYKPDEPAKA